MGTAAKVTKGKTIVSRLGPAPGYLEQFAVDINGNGGLERLSVGNQSSLLFL